MRRNVTSLRPRAARLRFRALRNGLLVILGLPLACAESHGENAPDPSRGATSRAPDPSDAHQIGPADAAASGAMQTPFDTEPAFPDGDPCPGGLVRSAQVLLDPARPCSLSPALPQADDPKYMLVSLDGQKLWLSAADQDGDYRWIGDALELLGPVCERAKSATADAHTISIFYAGGCPEAIGHCDDHLVAVEPILLHLQADSVDTCALHFEYRPRLFEPARLRIDLELHALVRDASDGYRLEGDTVHLLGGACSHFTALDAGVRAIRASYGPCYNLE